ncbi:MAG: cbb3-type cytochrome oxidase assembly protein CcoS [Bacteroidetes bacterium]|nr:cbb3-type cytochrome oxidase assembly protein CcoS [Bacteroidota bacterium]
MNIFYLLIGVSLFAALIFLGAFIWAVRTGQFDDNETPSIRMLFDDEPPTNNNANTTDEITK